MNKVNVFFSKFFLAAIIFTGFEISHTLSSQTYKKVTIGNQVWMVENLDVDTFRNGKPITEAKTAEEWTKANEEFLPAWCYYDFNPENGTRYGKLYNYWAVSVYQGLAPEGWHIPSDEEWAVLEQNTGFGAAGKLKSVTGWLKNGNGTNNTGFTALPGGRCDSFGFFSGIGESGFWWSSSSEGSEISNGAWSRGLTVNNQQIEKILSDMGDGFSVRCIKD